MITALCACFLTCGIVGTADFYRTNDRNITDWTESTEFVWRFKSVATELAGDTKENAKDYHDGYYLKDLSYCYIENGEVLLQSDAFDYDLENIKSHSIYLIIENGEATDSKGISDKTLRLIISSDEFKQKNAEGTYTICICADDAPSSWYSIYPQYFAVFKAINEHPALFTALDVFCIVVSFFLAFYYFQMTGKKKADEPAKLWFVDYIPFELQLAVCGGIGFGAYVLFFAIFERYRDLLYSAVVFGLLCFAIWGMLFLFCTSFSRIAHSDKKLYKNFLTYWILFAVFKVLSFAIKMIVRLFGKLKASAKNTARLLFYKPGCFKRNVIILIILYFVVNALLALAIVALTPVPPFALLLAICDLAGNIAVVVKLLKYVKSLDMIISAGVGHTDIDMDIETLPQSLRMLAESMLDTNKELHRAINKAIKDERLKTELITNVSHDLKTPLTSIISYVDLLSKCDIEDERAQEYVAVLDDKGGKLKRLIDDLIEASKVTTGNISVSCMPMNLSELCLQATVDAQADFEKAGLELHVKQGEKPIGVLADGSKTFRVMENLLSNALKYSAKHSRVYVGVYEDNDLGVIEIKNISAQPLDISPDELTERFVRGDRARNSEGSGLGLSIAKELCKAQNGELEIIIDGDLFKARIKLPKTALSI